MSLRCSIEIDEIDTLYLNVHHYRCYIDLNVGSCAGGCSSSSYTNLDTLAPVRRCTFCQPTEQRVQTFTNVLLTCPLSSVQRSSTEPVEVIATPGSNSASSSGCTFSTSRISPAQLSAATRTLGSSMASGYPLYRVANKNCEIINRTTDREEVHLWCSWKCCVGVR